MSPRDNAKLLLQGWEQNFAITPKSAGVESLLKSG